MLLESRSSTQNDGQMGPREQQVHHLQSRLHTPTANKIESIHFLLLQQTNSPQPCRRSFEATILESPALSGVSGLTLHLQKGFGVSYIPHGNVVIRGPEL